MRTSLAVILALAGTSLNGPAAADDLIYRYSPFQLEALKAYNRQPYWRPLAECAGIYGALVNHHQTAGRDAAAATARAEGVRFLTVARDRLTSDRGLKPKEATRLTLESVETGRNAGETLLMAKPVVGGVGREQLIELFCSQVDDAHRSALRFTRR